MNRYVKDKDSVQVTSVLMVNSVFLRRLYATFTE